MNKKYQLPTLPITQALPSLIAALQERDEAVLEAPPGAGKTTLVPLALLDTMLPKGEKILILEPRRLAARAAAERMSELLSEDVGGTVGYRVRLDSKVSKSTRIEVVTEGVLIRLLQDDPSLEGIGLIIFDEFHERSLDADLGLALTLQARGIFREQSALKLLIMSATLDGDNIAKLLNNAPIIRSEGRCFPVELRYGEPWRIQVDIIAKVINVIRDALACETGSLLVFLPGQFEIRKVHQGLQNSINSSEVLLSPLYGDLSLQEQRKAIAPAASGQRKIVLATAIAETSLTIEGIRVVIDAGLSRQAVFDPNTGMTRLDTCRVSQAASVQRAGRAGRLEAGICYRLWSEDQQQQLSTYTPPEIMQADLAPLALQLMRWGIDDIKELDWLDPPPEAPFNQAIDLLLKLAAVEKTEQGKLVITHHGEKMAKLPANPRLAHMLLIGQDYGLAQRACHLAAILSERVPRSFDGVDIEYPLALLNKEITSDHSNKGWLNRTLQQSRQFMRLCPKQSATTSSATPITEAESDRWTGFLIACAYPDRIAKQRSTKSKSYLLSNGRSVQFNRPDSLQNHSLLAIAQSGGRKGQATDSIYLACKLDSSLFSQELAASVAEKEVLAWDKQNNRFTAEQQSCVGAIILSRKNLATVSNEAKHRVLIELLKQQGLRLLPWNEELRQWQARVLLLRELDLQEGKKSAWPDISDLHLLDTADQWLAGYLDPINTLDHFKKIDLKSILLAQLPWSLQKKLEVMAPLRMKVASGSSIKINYEEEPPVLAVRLQEMYGCQQTPSIANGRIVLKLHLLSPARRPIQITQDLVGFWQSSYSEVKKDMKACYPKHFWPDDPLNAQALSGTRKTKK